MVRKLDARDFRARRMTLEPDDFALHDGTSEPGAPPDLINREVWHGIMDIADDVAVTTTSYQGTRVELLYHLWCRWIEAMPHGCMVGYAMLDCSDDFAASIFSLMHGFYRQAVGTLRSTVETMMFACLCQLTGSTERWQAWEQGKEEIGFREVRHELRKTGPVKDIEDRALHATGRTVLADRNRADPGGWATSCYRELSNFIHARGDSSNASMWRSNGPIYIARGMKVSYHSYLETYALGLLLAKIAHPALAMPDGAEVLFTHDGRRRYLRPHDRKLCGFLKKEVFGVG